MIKFVWGYVERTINRLERLLDRVEEVQVRPSTFRIMAYQMSFNPFETVEQVLDFFRARLSDVERYSPAVVAFPRFFGDLFFGLVPFSKKKLREDRGADLTLKYGSLMRSAYLKFVKRFHDLTGIVVVGGTILIDGKEDAVIADSKSLNIFGPSEKLKRNFEVLGTRCTFLFPSETKDYRMVREFSEGGSRIFFTTENMEGDFDEWEMKKGIWARSQSIGVVGVNSSMSGEFLGKIYTGLTFVSAPAILTKNFDGFIVRLSSPEKSGMIVADINVEALENFLRSLPKTYRKYRSFV